MGARSGVSSTAWPPTPILQPSQGDLNLAVKGSELRSEAWLLTFPPIITVRGTTNLLGSCLMPVKKKRSGGQVCPPDSTHPAMA